VDLQKPRLRAVAEASLTLAPEPGGFTVSELAERVRPALATTAPPYAARQASYDLAKLRGKALVERVAQTRRYRVRPTGIRILAGLLILRERVIEPVLAGLGKPRVGRPPKHLHPIDQHDRAARRVAAHLPHPGPGGMTATPSQQHVVVPGALSG